MKYYFFKTAMERGKQRLLPLSGQTFINGEPIDPRCHTQADKKERDAHPIGTIFYSTCIFLHNAGSKTYYSAPRIRPVLTPDPKPTLLIHNEDMGAEIKAALRAIIGTLPEPETPKAENRKNKTEEKPEPKKKSTKAPSMSTGLLFADDEDYADTKSDSTPMTLLEQIRTDDKLSAPTIAGDGFYVNPGDWMILVRNIRSQVNTLMIGPTGSGKTQLIILACRRLGIPCHVYDMGSMIDPVSSLLGVHRLNEKGASVFDYAKFTEDIQNPGVILLDELSRAPASTNNILFPCLDDRRSLPVEIAGGKDMRNIKVNPKCTFVATANIGDEYTGTNMLDAALTNRFFPVELTYAPEEKEKELLQKRCGIAEDIAENIANVAQKTRDLYRKQELSTCMSTRETLMTAGLVKDGWTALEAMERIFLPLYEGTKTEGERGIMEKIIISR